MQGDRSTRGTGCDLPVHTAHPPAAAPQDPARRTSQAGEPRWALAAAPGGAISCGAGGRSSHVSARSRSAGGTGVGGCSGAAGRQPMSSASSCCRAKLKMLTCILTKAGPHQMYDTNVAGSQGWLHLAGDLGFTPCTGVVFEQDDQHKALHVAGGAGGTRRSSPRSAAPQARCSARGCTAGSHARRTASSASV